MFETFTMFLNVAETVWTLIQKPQSPHSFTFHFLEDFNHGKSFKVSTTSRVSRHWR